MNVLQITELLMLEPENWAEKYTVYLLKFAQSKISDPELAKDLVQDTFLAGLEMLERFENKSSEKTWLTSILKNKIFLVYRKQAAAIVRLNAESPHPTLGESRREGKARDSPLLHADHHDPLIAKEFHYYLNQSVYKLPSIWRSVFEMKHFYGEETEHICSKLKISPANYWVICHRTKQNLRSGFLKHWER